mmetsp:Transcript_18674/g.26304  ORF Transcript_18674/g.26304 Transcript_18674/m.26304 type:complete len:211 (+) Transcript_18674:259-891(+)
MALYPFNLLKSKVFLNSFLSALNASKSSCATMGETVLVLVVRASNTTRSARGLQFGFAASKASYLRYPFSDQKLSFGPLLTICSTDFLLLRILSRSDMQISSGYPQRGEIPNLSPPKVGPIPLRDNTSMYRSNILGKAATAIPPPPEVPPNHKKKSLRASKIAPDRSDSERCTFVHGVDCAIDDLLERKVDGAVKASVHVATIVTPTTIK